MKKICILFFLVCINNHSAHAAGIIEPEIQDAINEYFGHHEYEESDFSRHVNNLSRRDYDPKFREEAARADIAKYEQRNQAIRQDPQLYDRIQAKIQQLVERRDSDALSILDAINSDADLSIVFPTEPAKDGLIKQIQQSIDDASNPYNTANRAKGDKGFFSELVGSIFNDSDNLPLKQLEGIHNKIRTANQIRGKIDKTKKGLLSIDYATRSKALKDLQCYEIILNNLALTEEEQQLWNTYRDKYYELRN